MFRAKIPEKHIAGIKITAAQDAGMEKMYL